VRERPGKDGRRKRDKDAQLGAEIGSDAERERDKGGAVALRVADEPDLQAGRAQRQSASKETRSRDEIKRARAHLLPAGHAADLLDERRHVVHGKLADRPVPEPRIAPAKALVAHAKDAASVAEPDLVLEAALAGRILLAARCEPEGERPLFRGDEGARRLEEAVHDEDRERRPALDRAGRQRGRDDALQSGRKGRVGEVVSAELPSKRCIVRGRLT
jgi:hypothetical protein